jgi:hypothetical protein
MDDGIMKVTIQTCFAMALLVLSMGCGGSDVNRKATFPVKGKVTAPGSGIQIECHPVAGLDTQNPTVSRTECDAEGTFSISTYTAGDGVPAGDYILTFVWQEFNIMSRNYGGPDKLKGRYADAAKSTVKVTVKSEGETDLGEIALVTK